MTRFAFVPALVWLVAAFSASLATPAQAQIKRVLNDTWKGTYVCGKARGEIYLIVSDRGDRLVFAGDDRSGGEYRLGSGYSPNTRSYMADLRPVTPLDGARPQSFRGTVSSDGQSMKATLKGCDVSDLARGSAAAPAIAAKETPQAPAQPEGPTATSVAEREADGFVGSWEGGATACLKGPFSLRVDFSKLDADGSDATITIRANGEPEQHRLRARTSKGRVGLVVNAPPTAAGRFSRAPISFELTMRGLNRMDGFSGPMNCTGMRLTRATAAQDSVAAAPPLLEELPPEHRAILGAWDGAAYDHTNFTARRVSIEIRLAKTDLKTRMFDTRVTIDGQEHEGVILSTKGDRLAILAPTGSGRPGIVLDTRLTDRGGRTLMMATTSGAGHGITYLWRRPESRKQPLQQICDDLAPLIDSRVAARRLARDLKVAFYPALLSYDADLASVSQTVADLDARGMSDLATDFNDMLVECILSERIAQSPISYFAGAFIRTDDVLRRRIIMTRTTSPETASLSASSGEVSLGGVKAAKAKAEAALPSLIDRMSNEITLDGILGVLESGRASIQSVAPENLAISLEPLRARLSDAFSAQTAKVAEERRARASEIMSGMPIPRSQFPNGRGPLLESIVDGSFTILGKDDIGFLAGMFARSVEACGRPKLETRLALVELLRKGTLLALGTDYMGTIAGSAKSVAAGNANFLSGVAFVEDVGCDERFTEPFYEALKVNWPQRSQAADGRAPLFVRSCALDRAPAECQCMMSVIETVQPSISRQTYSRDAIRTSMEMNPIVGVNIMSACGVSDY